MAEKNLLPQWEQRSGEAAAPAGGDEGDDASAAAFPAL